MDDMEEVVKFIKADVSILVEMIQKLSSVESERRMIKRYGNSSKKNFDRLKLQINRLNLHLTDNSEVSYRPAGNIVGIRESLQYLNELLQQITDNLWSEDSFEERDGDSSLILLIEASSYAESIFLSFYLEYIICGYENKVKTFESKMIESERAMEQSEKDSKALLERMKLTESAVFREGLTGAFKSRMNWLRFRIFGFDFLNYLSLFLIFIVTLSVLVNVDSIGFFQIIEFKTVEIYERFLLITPLIFLSWFASKRSQFLYQIKEEYTYKYAVGLAYEGYKNEVKDNPRMQERLMDVTLDNLARSPLEQFDKNSDHSPYLQVIKELRLNSDKKSNS